MAEKAKRQALSLKRKLEIIVAVESQPKKKRNIIADEFKVHPSTLTALMKKKEKYKEQYYSGNVDPEQQKRRPSKYEEVDDKLLEWFRYIRAGNIPVSGPVMKAKAEELSRTLGLKDWKCSEGWLHRWKKRHNISHRAMTDEKEPVYEQATGNCVEDLLDWLKPALEQYDPSDIFTLDETALYWRLLPDKTSSFKADKCHRGEKPKERLTVMICTNMDGSEKLPLLTVGRFQNPQCFTGIQKLPVKYKANQKSWMTPLILEDWLQSFDREMNSQNRRVLLVIENCSAHQVQRLDLKATYILFLPPSATSVLRPCDLGIIQTLKAHYRKLNLLKMINHTDEGGAPEDFQLTLLDAVCTLKRAWNKVTPSLIFNCFRKAYFKDDGTSITSADDELNQCIPVVNLMQEPLLLKLFEQWNVSPSDYLGVDDDVATMGPERTASCITPTPSTATQSQDIDPDADDDDTGDDCGKPKKSVSQKAALDCVRMLNTYCMQAGCSDSVMKPFGAFVDALDEHLTSDETQPIINLTFANSRSLGGRQRKGRPRKDRVREAESMNRTDEDNSEVKEQSQNITVKIERATDDFRMEDEERDVDHEGEQTGSLRMEVEQSEGLGEEADQGNRVKEEEREDIGKDDEWRYDFRMEEKERHAIKEEEQGTER